MTQEEKNKIYEEVQALAIKTNYKMQETFVGNFKSIFSGEGMDFKESKIYSDGENFKHIDWKTSAKTGKLFVKKFEETRKLKINLIIDSSISLNTGFQDFKKNKLIEAVALIVFSAMKSGDRISLKIIGGKEIPLGAGKNHSFKILENLISEKFLSKNLDYKKFFDEINLSKNSKGKSIFFFFSDFENKNFSEGIKKINPKHQKICVFIRDNLEEILKNSEIKNGVSEFENPENSDEKILIDWKKFPKFQKFLDQKIFEKRKNFAKFGIESLEIYEGKNVMDNFLEFFKLGRK